LQQQCSATQPGTLLVTFQWQAPGGGSQWLDLSLFDNGFAPGTLVGVGPLPPDASTFAWDGLKPGMTHYVRVNTFTRAGWVPTQTLAFTTGLCGGPAVLGQPTQACGAPGTVHVIFGWTPSVPGGSVQWLDLSLSNVFAVGGFLSAGPLDPATASFTWTGLRSGLVHYWRVNTLTPTGWQASSIGSFLTDSCPEGRAPGQVRTLPAGLTDQLACYQLGQADAALDRAAGVTLQVRQVGMPWVQSPWVEIPWYTPHTGFVFSVSHWPTPQSPLTTTVSWLERDTATAEVALGEGTSVACGQAYIDGYRGVQFQQR